MAGVEIGTLRLRGPPHLATRAAFRIEDGLRTELADGRRLILIRRMRPGPRAVSGRPEVRSGAIRLAYEAATRDARHGRDAGDGAFVNCVWFESAAEARRLLLAELLAGRRPTGWFWRMAVPDWQGREPEVWLSDIVARALRGADEREALALVLFVLEAADVELVARAVQAAAGSPLRLSPPAPLVRRDGFRNETRRSPDGAEGQPSLRETVTAIRARLPGPLRDRVETLARRLGPGQVAVLRLLERLLLDASPALALAPGPLRELASAWSELIAEPAETRPRPPGPASPPPTERARTAEPAGPSAPPTGAAADLPRIDAPATPPSPAITGESGHVDAPCPAGDAPLVPRAGRASDVAGLWLILPSLIRLGFREWLRERPSLLRQDAGRTLIRTLARRHRVPDSDPALAPFEALDALGETPDWARFWHKGLDGWLRRRAGMPLHRLLRKRGEVELADEALTVRFPLDAADIRLRRRALDVDPGWVDWLGLSVRYRYEEKGR